MLTKCWKILCFVPNAPYHTLCPSSWGAPRIAWLFIGDRRWWSPRGPIPWSAPRILHRANGQEHLSNVQSSRQFLRIPWRSDRANNTALGRYRGDVWDFHLGARTSNAHVWRQRLRRASAFCPKETNAEFPCAPLHGTHRAGLEARLWPGLSFSNDSAMLHAGSTARCRRWNRWELDPKTDTGMVCRFRRRTRNIFGVWKWLCRLRVRKYSFLF